jgi:hypothetical protein
MINKARANAALMLTAIALITSCGGTSSPASSSGSPLSAPQSPAPQSPAWQSPAVNATTFTSATYGYTVTLPRGWTSMQASAKWDVHIYASGLAYGGIDRYSISADQFRRCDPDTATCADSDPAVFALAGPWARDLAAFTKLWIVSNADYHEHCPPKPSKKNRIKIGGQPGVLLAFNCGILVDIAATVHSGVGYSFFLTDFRVQEATDPADHATLLNILRSVHFPD